MILKVNDGARKCYFVSYSYSETRGNERHSGFGNVCVTANMSWFEEINKVMEKIKETLDLDSVVILNFIEIEGP